MKENLEPGRQLTVDDLNNARRTSGLYLTDDERTILHDGTLLAGVLLKDYLNSYRRAPSLRDLEVIDKLVEEGIDGYKVVNFKYIRNCWSILESMQRVPS